MKGENFERGVMVAEGSRGSERLECLFGGAAMQ